MTSIRVASNVATASARTVTKRTKTISAMSSEPPPPAACQASNENCQTAGLLIVVPALTHGLNPAAGNLHELADVLFHALRIDVAGETHHQITERVDDVDVIAWRTGSRQAREKIFCGEHDRARAPIFDFYGRRRPCAVRYQPDAFDAIPILALREADLTHHIQLRLAIVVAAPRVGHPE